MKFNEESLDKSIKALIKKLDDELKNVNTLSKITNAEMKLYVLNGNYFDTKEKLENYIMESNCNSINDFYILEYIRRIFNRKDVIKKISSDSTYTFYTAIDRFGYGIYDRSEYTWEFCYGCISEMYTQFRNRGIIFEDDIYGKIEENDKELIKMVKQKCVISI